MLIYFEYRWFEIKYSCTGLRLAIHYNAEFI